MKCLRGQGIGASVGRRACMRLPGLAGHGFKCPTVPLSCFRPYCVKELLRVMPVVLHERDTAGPSSD